MEFYLLSLILIAFFFLVLHNFLFPNTGVVSHRGKYQYGVANKFLTQACSHMLSIIYVRFNFIAILI